MYSSALPEWTTGCPTVKDSANEEIGSTHVEVGDETMVEHDKVGESIGGASKASSDNDTIDAFASDTDYANAGFHTCNITVVDKNTNCDGVSTDTHCATCLGELLIAEVVSMSPNSSPPDLECHDSLVAGWAKTNTCSDSDVLDM